jgi:hypothetical protein
MLIGRCAWHPRYYGYPLWSGIASWRGFKIGFTDGICDRCLRRLRADYRALLGRREPAREEIEAKPAA